MSAKRKAMMDRHALVDGVLGDPYARETVERAEKRIREAEAKCDLWRDRVANTAEWRRLMPEGMAPDSSVLVYLLLVLVYVSETRQWVPVLKAGSGTFLRLLSYRCDNFKVNVIGALHTPAMRLLNGGPVVEFAVHHILSEVFACVMVERTEWYVVTFPDGDAVTCGAGEDLVEPDHEVIQNIITGVVDEVSKTFAGLPVVVRRAVSHLAANGWFDQPRRDALARDGLVASAGDFSLGPGDLAPTSMLVRLRKCPRFCQVIEQICERGQRRNGPSVDTTPAFMAGQPAKFKDMRRIQDLEEAGAAGGAAAAAAAPRDEQHVVDNMDAVRALRRQAHAAEAAAEALDVAGAMDAADGTAGDSNADVVRAAELEKRAGRLRAHAQTLLAAAQLVDGVRAGAQQLGASAAGSDQAAGPATSTGGGDDNDANDDVPLINWIVRPARAGADRADTRAGHHTPTTSPTPPASGAASSSSPPASSSSSTPTSPPTGGGRKGGQRECGVCGESISRNNFARHMRVHTGDTKNYKCEYPGCDHASRERGNLKTHMRVHTGEKPYPCRFPGCSKTFSWPDGRKNHMRTHTGEKPYRCGFPGCSRAFGDRSSVAVHRHVHGEKKFACPKCNRLYSTEKNLPQVQPALQHREKPEAPREDLQGRAVQQLKRTFHPGTIQPSKSAKLSSPPMLASSRSMYAFRLRTRFLLPPRPLPRRARGVAWSATLTRACSASLASTLASGKPCTPSGDTTVVPPPGARASCCIAPTNCSTANTARGTTLLETGS